VEVKLSATGYVVLGLMSARPRAGHELAQYAEKSIGQFFPLTRSHVYSELDRLSRLGLLEATEVRQERLPTKRVYEITEAGEDALAEWLERPGLPGARQRNLFLVHVFLGDRMSSARLEEMLDAYDRATREARDRYSQAAAKMAERPQARFRRAAALYGAAQMQATLDWLAEVRPLLLESRVGDSA
jgi:DNA-binding PadR family transcriptional regulator